MPLLSGGQCLIDSQGRARRKFSEDYTKYYKVDLFGAGRLRAEAVQQLWQVHLDGLDASICPVCEGYTFMGKPPTSVRMDYTVRMGRH